MKLWYLLMNFNGGGVTGMMSIANTPDEARKNCLKLVNSKIKLYRTLDNFTANSNLKREIAFRRTLNNPHRKRKYSSFQSGRYEPILKIMEIDGAFHTGYWIGLSDNDYFCNTPRVWEQDPENGLYYSELKK